MAYEGVTLKSGQHRIVASNTDRQGRPLPAGQFLADEFDGDYFCGGGIIAGETLRAAAKAKWHRSVGGRYGVVTH